MGREARLLSGSRWLSQQSCVNDACLGHAEPRCPSQASENPGKLALLSPHKAQSEDSERVLRGLGHEGAVAQGPRLQGIPEAALT